MSNDPGNACLRKDAFPTSTAARKVAKAGKPAKGFKVKAYKCPYCPYYHVGRDRIRLPAKSPKKIQPEEY